MLDEAPKLLSQRRDGAGGAGQLRHDPRNQQGARQPVVVNLHDHVARQELRVARDVRDAVDAAHGHSVIAKDRHDLG